MLLKFFQLQFYVLAVRICRRKSCSRNLANARNLLSFNRTKSTPKTSSWMISPFLNRERIMPIFWKDPKFVNSG